MGGNGQMPNPRRVGLWAVVTDKAIKERMPFPDEFIQWALEHRFLFITEESWDKLGLPRENINNMEESNNE